jgi:hypothetical protein
MNDPSDPSEIADERSPTHGRIEIALWIGLLVFGSWVALEWMSAEPAPSPAPPPPVAKWPEKFIEAEMLGVRASSRPFEFALSQAEANASGAWSGDAWMQSRGAIVGDSIAFGVPRRYPGDYRIAVYLTRAPENGVVVFSLNGERLGDVIDLYSEGDATATGEIVLGVAPLQGRGDRLRVEVLAASDSGAGSADFGIDGYHLEKVDREP